MQELRINESVYKNKQVVDTRKNVESEQEENAPVVSTVESMFESEKAMTLATDSLRRLGFKNKIMPLKVTSDGELYSVELEPPKQNSQSLGRHKNERSKRIRNSRIKRVMLAPWKEK